MKNAMRWLALLVLLSGCDLPLPGKPDPANKFVAPTKVLDFPTLYGKNCAGCHGKDGKMGPAPPLNDAVFLAIAPETELATVITGGRKGTEIAAFALEKGGHVDRGANSGYGSRYARRNGGTPLSRRTPGPLTSSLPREETWNAALPSSLEYVPHASRAAWTRGCNAGPNQ